MAFRIKATEDELRFSHIIAQQVELLDISITDTEVRTNRELLESAGGNARIKLDPKYSGYKLLGDDDDRQLIAYHGLQTRFIVMGNGADLTELAKIEVLVRAVYQLPRGPIPDVIGDEQFNAFSKFNALYNCWPYLRQHVNYLSQAIGTSFVVPVLLIEGAEDIKTEDLEHEGEKKISSPKKPMKHSAKPQSKKKASKKRN